VDASKFTTTQSMNADKLECKHKEVIVKQNSQCVMCLEARETTETKCTMFFDRIGGVTKMFCLGAKDRT
jgi:hypothetical protein